MSDLIWLFMLWAMVIPFARRGLKARARRGLIAELERARGTRAILLVHRPGPLPLFGAAVPRFIGLEDAEEVVHAIRTTPPTTPIDLVLHTPGGLVMPSVQIARAIAAHPAPVTAFVPEYAMSGGTLIALAADAIVMNEHAVLGPTDPVIGTTPAASVRSVLARKPLDRIDDQTLILADQAEKAIRQLSRTVRELLAGRVEPAVAEEIAERLCEGAWTHDFPITFREARAMGLPVRCDMPEAVNRLVRLHAEPPSSVDYLPLPLPTPALPYR